MVVGGVVEANIKSLCLICSGRDDETKEEVMV